VFNKRGLLTIVLLGIVVLLGLSLGYGQQLLQNKNPQKPATQDKSSSIKKKIEAVGSFPVMGDVEGKIIASTPEQVAIQTKDGTRTFALAKNVTVQKVLSGSIAEGTAKYAPGSINDLVGGRTVRILIEKNIVRFIWVIQ